jgi:RecQ family ATP-dependent DNA helicase
VRVVLPARLEEITGWGLVVCISQSCQHAVWPNQIESHCRRAKHNMSASDAKVIADRYIDKVRYTQSSGPFQVPQSIEQAIPQLPLFTDGLLCEVDTDGCHYVCRKLESMLQHCRLKHGWTRFAHRGQPNKVHARRVKMMPWRQNIHCQQFFAGGRHSGFFEVRQPRLQESSQQPHSQSESNFDAFSQFIERGEQRLAEARRALSGTIGDGEADEINQWLERTRWTIKLRKLERADLMACIAEPDGTEEPIHTAIWGAMEELIKIAQDTVKLKAGIFLRMEAIRAEKNQRRYRPLQPYRSEKTLHDNVRPWQNILMFFARTRDRRKWKRLRWKFTQQQERAWKTLEICATRSASGRISDSERERDEGGQASDLEQSQSSTDTTKRSLTSLQKACLQFCISLLDQKVSRDEYDCAMVWALAVLGVQKDSWSGPSSYPPILSAIIKTGRFLVVQKAFEDVGNEGYESGRSTSSSTSSSMNSSVNDGYNGKEDHIRLHNSDIDSAINKEVEMNNMGCVELVKKMMNHFMVRGTHGPMEWMLDLRTYGMKIFFNTTSSGNVDWDGNILLYKSLQLRVPAFRSMIHGLVDETRRILIEDLMLMGKGSEQNCIPPIPWSSLRDNPADSRTGWNFLKDQRTKWPVRGDNWLRDRIKADVNLQRHFKLPHQPNRTNTKGIAMYMERLAEFREKLLVLMHITGGQPARAPEILSICHSNTIKGGIRNVFVENGLIVFVTGYHKGYQVSGEMKIIHRYLPREVGELVVWYLWLVLPWVQIVEASAHNLEVDNKPLSMHMWPTDASGLKWSSVRMRQVMKREFTVGMQTDINIQSYREIAIAMSRKWLRGKAFVSDDDDEDGDWDEGGGEGHDDHIADLQAAHSSHVAGMVYARGIMEMSGVIADRRTAFRQTSVAWHEFLEFESTKEESLSKKRPAETQLYKLEAENARFQRWKRMRTMDWNKPLQQLIGPAAEFRGVQEAAIKAIGTNDSPIVVVMPTGGGKSLLFMLPALCHPDGVTLVVVPLISLREDLKRRCEEIGITCREWSSRNPPDAAAIVLVTPEATTLDAFAVFLNRMRVTHQLDRIVIDECHILLNRRESFRPMIKNLSKLTASCVQMVLLTGTLPVSLQSELYQQMGFLEHEVQIFRGITTRENLQYSVEQLPLRTTKDEKDEYILRLVRRKLKGLNGAGKLIVFCNSIAQTVELAAKLNCEAYYSRLESQEKAYILDDFRKKSEAIIVATSALGMGVDIPDIRVVIHVDKPRNLLDYAQETGRGGRDGKASEVILIVKEEMVMSSEQSSSISKEDRLVQRYIFGTQHDDKPICRRVVLDEYLDGRTDRKSCEDGEASCDVCKSLQNNMSGDENETDDEDMNDEAAAWMVYDFESESHEIDEGHDMSQIHEQHDQYLQDEFRYQEQRMKLVHRREVERMGKDGPVIEKLVRRLQHWGELCSICVVAGEDYEHDFAQCTSLRSAEAHSWAERVATTIQFAKYSGCFKCGVPQAICNRWQMKLEGAGFERNDLSDCQYARVMIRMLGGIYTGRGSRIRERWADRMRKWEIDIEDMMAMMRYLQKKHLGEYKEVQRESNNMVWEFFWLSQQIEV